MGTHHGVLAGKVAIVTGGGSGIGRGIALELSREGAHVVITSRRAAVVEEQAQKIRDEGGSALGVVCDVRFEDQVQSMVERAVAEFGPIDILVNAAQGFSGRGSNVPTRYPLESYPDDEWDYLFQSGLKGTLYAMKAVYPSMQGRGGKIINFGSEVGQKGGVQFAAYAATKEAIRALSRSAAREWGPQGINVNVINPVIETEQSSWPNNPAAREQVLAASALGRVAKPEEAGRIAVFLAGPDSDYLTGMTFMVDGGRFMFA